jgi:subtilisin family serine protease
VVISAPGVDITGAAPVRGYLTVNGTSPASAFVAGAAALIRSRYPRLGPALVRQALVESARYRPASGYSPGVGFGEVDAAAALEVAGRLAARPPVTGLAPAAHFGARTLPGPVRVIPRDLAGIAAARHIQAAGALGFITGLLILAMIIGRGRRPRAAQPGDAAQPADPARSG